jgi:hypothetical protein
LLLEGKPALEESKAESNGADEDQNEAGVLATQSWYAEMSEEDKQKAKRDICSHNILLEMDLQ